jgi:hypothetical protein
MDKPGLSHVHYWHDAFIEAIVANPLISQGDLARLCGYSESWVSIMVNTDAFKNRLAERKAEISDPILRASVKERVEAAAKRSLDKLIERMDANAPMKTNELIAIAKLGVEGAPAPINPFAQTNNYIVQLPPVAQTSAQWLAASKGRGVPEVIDVSPRGLGE